MMKALSLFALLFISFNINSQNVVINEIITSNSTVLTDEDGSYEDWIELFNPTASPINLQGYGLTDLSSNPYQWVFPQYSIELGEHLLIWCSGKNKTDSNFPLHTNFRISAGGETITLTHPNTTIVDRYAPIIIPQNYSYGRQTDG